MSSNSTLRTILNNSSRQDVPLVEKIDQCDLAFLFSHLSNSIRFAHEDILKNGQNFNFEEESTYKLTCAIVCILFGLFFAIGGYRFLKLSTFIVGFSLGSGVIYLILSEQKQLSTVENIIISLSIGVLFAFVALLVQYIGLFLIGITSSISIVTCILILIDLFYSNQSAWVCIGLLFICATVLASITLKFQKSLTIINTSIIGSALLFVAVDFIVENNLLIDYIHELFKVNGHIFNIYERQKALLQTSNRNLPATVTTVATKKLSTNTPILESTFQRGNSTINNSALALLQRLYSSANAKLCWYTWIVFGSFFVILFLSLLIQFLCTGRNYDHRDSWQKLIRGSRKKKTANLEKIRLKSHLNDSETRRTHLSSNHQAYTSSARSSISSASNLNLVATNKNDTLLLVESGANTHLTYTSSSRASDESTKLPLNQKNSQKANDIESDFEIVSFEVVKSAKSVRKTTKPASNRQPPTKIGKNKLNSKLSSATTVSTSSTGSSNSSTCQLIPMKLNSGSVSTASTSVGNCLDNCPGSPVKALPAVTSYHHGTLQPPPVPTLPPPKLPVNLTISSKSDTINSSLSLTNSILVPALPLVGVKKSYRHNGGLGAGKSDPKTQSGDKFRQLYQIRRNHGDVLSQDFLKNIQTKQNSSSTHLNSSFIESNTFELRSASLNTNDKKANLKKKQKE